MEGVLEASDALGEVLLDGALGLAADGALHEGHSEAEERAVLRLHKVDLELVDAAADVLHLEEVRVLLTVVTNPVSIKRMEGRGGGKKR